MIFLSAYLLHLLTSLSTYIHVLYILYMLLPLGVVTKLRQWHSEQAAERKEAR